MANWAIGLQISGNSAGELLQKHPKTMENEALHFEHFWTISFELYKPSFQLLIHGCQVTFQVVCGQKDSSLLAQIRWAEAKPENVMWWIHQESSLTPSMHTICECYSFNYNDNSHDPLAIVYKCLKVQGLTSVSQRPALWAAEALGVPAPPRT